MAQLYINREAFERMIAFGKNKDKLGLLLFSDKVVSNEQSPSSALAKKKITIAVSDEDLERLDSVHQRVMKVKERHDFSNLHGFLVSLEKAASVIEGASTMEAPALTKALTGVSISSFFKQTDFITRLNLLNYKDDVFIMRFDKIVMVGSSEKPRAEAELSGRA